MIKITGFILFKISESFILENKTTINKRIETENKDTILLQIKIYNI